MSAPSRGPHVALYLRISHDPNALRVGVERQLTDCTAIARRWPEHRVVVYEDNDVSALTKRPEYTRMCTAIEHGEVRALVAYDLDRLHRQPRELEAFIDLCEKVALRDVVTAQGDLDLSTHDGQLMARIMVAVAKKASDDSSRRVRRAARQRAERGAHHGGPAPYPYTRVDGELILNAEGAAHLREIAARVLSGASLGSLLSDPLSTRQGLRGALLNPVIAGRNRLGVRGTWEPVLSDTQYAALVTLLTDPSRVPSHSRRRVHWLTGLARCALCDGALYNRTPLLRCKECSRVSVKIAMTQELVAEMLFARVELEREEFSREREHASVVVGRRTVEGEGGAKLPLLAADYAAGRITREEWLAARAVLIQSERDCGIPLRVASVVPLRDAWDSMSVGQQHHLACEMLSAIRVLPSHPQPRSARGLWTSDSYASVLSRLHPIWRV